MREEVARVDSDENVVCREIHVHPRKANDISSELTVVEDESLPPRFEKLYGMKFIRDREVHPEGFTIKGIECSVCGQSPLYDRKEEVYYCPVHTQK
jgi:uncharacterized protein (UPF0305 family)